MSPTTKQKITATQPDLSLGSLRAAGIEVSLSASEVKEMLFSDDLANDPRKAFKLIERVVEKTAAQLTPGVDGIKKQEALDIVSAIRNYVEERALPAENHRERAHATRCKNFAQRLENVVKNTMNPQLNSLDGIPIVNLELLEKHTMNPQLTSLDGIPVVHLTYLDVYGDSQLNDVGRPRTARLSPLGSMDVDPTEDRIQPTPELVEVVTFKGPTTLRKPEHDGLATFAKMNNLDINEVLNSVIIRDGSVQSAKFDDMVLTTLEGLSSLQALEDLDLSDNYSLRSLNGAPTQALRRLSASGCELRDLAALQGANMLEILDISWNPGITSLHEIPLGNLRELYVAKCGRIRDLAPLLAAEKLERLAVSDNRDLRSLAGVPTGVRMLVATSCGLTTNLLALRNAENLAYLDISHNPQLGSFYGLPTRDLEHLAAEHCGLTGSLDELYDATRLTALYLRGNSDIDRGQADTVLSNLRKKNLRTLKI